MVGVAGFEPTASSASPPVCGARNLYVAVSNFKFRPLHLLALPASVTDGGRAQSPKQAALVLLARCQYKKSAQIFYNSVLMVGVAGFEPTASCSQTQKHRFFASFFVLFRAFSSENRAFLCCKVHNSHVVRCCKWSRLWSAPKSRISIPPHTSRKLNPRWIFCCNHYSIKQRNIQVLHGSKSDTL